MAAKAKKFEDELKELEEIVERIDSGELSLEESIAAFERGVGLVRSLNLKLDEVERKVEVLTRSVQGDLRSEPLENITAPRGPAAGENADQSDLVRPVESIGDRARPSRDDDIPF
jgi:exodeoxyribonuclease VII small subunit